MASSIRAILGIRGILIGSDSAVVHSQVILDASFFLAVIGRIYLIATLRWGDCPTDGK